MFHHRHLANTSEQKSILLGLLPDMSFVVRKDCERYLVLGMGGRHQAADAQYRIRAWGYPVEIQRTVSGEYLVRVIYHH